MNRAKIGVVWGVDDGAPAILTEYMLAGLPVLANVNLRCGLQYITPKTGATATEDKFHLGLRPHREGLRLPPRAVVLSNWTWPTAANGWPQRATWFTPEIRSLIPGTKGNRRRFSDD
jgi:hypothetical protein